MGFGTEIDEHKHFEVIPYDQFICGNWFTTDDGYGSPKTYEDTFFIGKTKENGFVIKNRYGHKMEVNFFGSWNGIMVNFYTGIHPKYKTTRVFAIAIAHSHPDFDVQIKEMNFHQLTVTNCKFDKP